MNKLIIIGNLTREPEARVTAEGQSVATFTLAVNRRTQRDHPEADYFRVTCWDKLAKLAIQYLDKGKRVCVIGPVRAQGFTTREGKAAASLEVTAYELELLSPREQKVDPQTGYQQTEDEGLPY